MRNEIVKRQSNPPLEFLMSVMVFKEGEKRKWGEWEIKITTTRKKKEKKNPKQNKKVKDEREREREPSKKEENEGRQGNRAVLDDKDLLLGLRKKDLLQRVTFVICYTSSTHTHTHFHFFFSSWALYCCRREPARRLLFWGSFWMDGDSIVSESGGALVCATNSF